MQRSCRRATESRRMRCNGDWQSTSCLQARTNTQRSARLRPDDGLHGAVPEPDRADSAGGAGDQERQRWAGSGFWAAAWNPRVVASYKLTFGTSLVAATINAVFGFIVAWTLVRYTIPGKKFIDAHGRPAVRAADGRLGHRADGRLRAERLVRPVPGAAGHQGGVLAAGHHRSR